MQTELRQRKARRRQPNTELIALRINAGMSRIDLEAKSGVSRESIRIAERGFVPGPRIQFRLARAFGRNPLDLWPLEHQPAVRR